MLPLVQMQKGSSIYDKKPVLHSTQEKSNRDATNILSNISQGSTNIKNHASISRGLLWYHQIPSVYL